MFPNQKIVPTSPIRSSTSGSSDTPNKILSISFKLKPVGFGGTKSTLVENDSLSSYSWPEESPRRQNGSKKVSGVKASDSGVLRDEGIKNKGDENKDSNIASKRPREENGHVAIDFNTQTSGFIQDPSYVEAYMKLMYWTCVSPFNPTKNLDGAGAESWFDLMLNVVQKILLAIISTLSMIQSVFEIKQNLLDNLLYPDLETFTDLGFFCMNGATKLYYMYLFLTQQGRLLKMLSSISKLRESRLNSHPTKRKLNSSIQYALILVASSIAINFIHTIFGCGIIGWTPEKAILHHSKILGKSISIWTKHDHGNDNLHDALDEKYGYLSKANFLFGLVRMMIVLCSNIQMDAVTNVMLTNAETVKEEMKRFERKIMDPKKDTDDVTLEQFLADDGQWAHFKLLKLTIQDTNDAMDALMRYKHINNVMLFVYIAMNAFDGQFPLIYFLRLVYNMILTSYTYRIASQASNLNETIKKWILRLAWKSTDKSFQEKVPLILYELEKEPMGVGKGQFLIDESFIFRFLGSAGSVFVLQAQTREVDVDCERV